MKLTSLAIALCLVAPLFADDTVTVYDFAPAVAAEGLRLHDEVERAKKAFAAWKHSREIAVRKKDDGGTSDGKDLYIPLVFSEDFKHAISRSHPGDVTVNPCWGGGVVPVSSSSNGMSASWTVEGAPGLIGNNYLSDVDPPYTGRTTLEWKDSEIKPRIALIPPPELKPGDLLRVMPSGNVELVGHEELGRGNKVKK